TLTGTGKLFAFRHMVNRIRPQIIHSYCHYTNFAAWWAALGTTTIPIGAVQSDLAFEKNSSGPLLGRLSGRWPRHQISNNLLAARSVCSSPSLFVPGRLSVVPNAVDLQSFRMAPLPTRRQIRMVGVGSLLPVKRWDRLLAVAAELNCGGFDFLIRIAGDGPLRRSLEQQAHDPGVSDRVKVFGHLDYVPSLLADSAFLIHASNMEGSPNSVIEAMACGRAIAATKVVDFPFLVVDRKAGFLVQCGGHEALVDRTVKLISDHDLCGRMG